MKQIEKQTINSYSFLWDKENKQNRKRDKTHFEILQNVLDEQIIKVGVGLEVGCGVGHDIEYMAETHPKNKFIAIDFTCSIFKVKNRLKHLNNIQFVRASALDLPFKKKSFDFIYSFGVLHHTTDPATGLHEINRVLKEKTAAVLYLYENHEDNIIKFYMLKIITRIRKITVMLPNKILFFLCIVFSPVVYFLFSAPAKFLNKFNKTKFIAQKLPFNFGRHPFNLVGDLFDRFATPIEFRYGKRKLISALKKAKFNNFKLNKIPDAAGWVIWCEK